MLIKVKNAKKSDIGDQISFQTDKFESEVYVGTSEIKKHMDFLDPEELNYYILDVEHGQVEVDEGWVKIFSIKRIRPPEEAEDENVSDEEVFDTEETEIQQIKTTIDNPVLQKMLNNLLGIRAGRENALFVNKSQYTYDLSEIVTEPSLQKIFKENSFNVPVEDKTVKNAMLHLEATTTKEEFLEMMDEVDLGFSKDDYALIESNYKKNKKFLLDRLKIGDASKANKWKRFRNTYLDKQVQINSWPLYIGTLFVKVKTPTTVFHAPLLVKKVKLNITKNNKISIESLDDSVELNEKLAFMLQQTYKFNIPALKENISSNFDTIAKKLMANFKDVIKPVDVIGKWKTLSKDGVANTQLEFTPGAVLFITHHSGGALRKRLSEIIRDNKIETLLDIDPLARPKSDAVEYMSERKGVYRITDSDISQELAVIGSMKSDSIIWGPPGTGKSQTIANLLANIMAQGKTAIVTSEKKAALDVIKVRMGKLSKYMFFGLADKNDGKDEFYKTFKEFAEMITKNPKIKSDQPTSILDESEWRFIEINEMLSNEDIAAVGIVRKYILNSKRSFDVAKKDLEVIIDNKDILDALIEVGLQNVDQVSIELNMKKPDKRIKKFIKQISIETKKYDLDESFLKVFKRIGSFENIAGLTTYRKIEEKYSVLNHEFKSDEDYLDALVANRLREKVNSMMTDNHWAGKMKVFLNNSKSGFKTPYKFIEEHKEIIQEVFPILISTPNMIASTIDFLREYDYAVFDEASQMHTEKALPIISIAKISVIAGDNQQMRPSSFFLIRDNSTEVYDETEEEADSLLDYAYRKGFGNQREYMLTKNYRSQTADLMLFSSSEFYENNLSVVDNSSVKPDESSIEVVEVGGIWKNSSNRQEAEAILKRARVEADNYKSIIILGLNASQRTVLEQKIYGDGDEKLISALEDGKIKLRNLENIQGDEAELVLISIGYDKNASLSSTYVARPEGRNALNVAVSRAIYKMVVFKSIMAEDVAGSAKNRSINTFKRWLGYLDLSPAERKAQFIAASTDDDSKEEKNKFETEFEKEVVFEVEEAIASERFNVLNKYILGSHYLDQVIIDKNTGKIKLGIQIHNYKESEEFEDSIKDIEWERFVKARGYTVYKITPILWTMNKEEILENIKKAIR